MSTVKLAVQV